MTKRRDGAVIQRSYVKPRMETLIHFYHSPHPQSYRRWVVEWRVEIRHWRRRIPCLHQVPLNLRWVQPMLRANCAVFALLMFLPMSVRAASSVYVLDQSNHFPDGHGYLEVTVDNEGVPGAINFHVALLDPLLDMAGKNFGIEKFAFNSVIDLDNANVIGLPENWRLDESEKNMAGFGRFDFEAIAKKRSARVTSLSFSIVKVPADTIASYLQPSVGKARDGHFLFSASVAGLSSEDFHHIPSVFFAGGTPIQVSPVPEPGVNWLLVAGLAVVGIFARRLILIRMMRTAMARLGLTGHVLKAISYRAFTFAA